MADFPQPCRPSEECLWSGRVESSLDVSNLPKPFKLSPYCNSLVQHLEAVTMASPRSESTVQAFISRHRTLLARERDAEIERTSLILSNASPKLLEQRGLALGGLSVVSAGVGLGGKTYVIVSYHRSLQRLIRRSVGW